MAEDSMGRAVVVVRRGRQPGDLPLDLLDLRLCRPGSSTARAWSSHQPRPRRITGVDFYDRYLDLREYTDSDAGATLTHVPPRNPRDGCWRLLAGSGCRLGCL